MAATKPVLIIGAGVVGLTLAQGLKKVSQIKLCVIPTRTLFMELIIRPVRHSLRDLRAR